MVKAPLYVCAGEEHSIVYHADFYHPAFPDCLGVLVDNDASMPHILLEQADREDKLRARQAFGALFPKGKVYIEFAWKIG